MAIALDATADGGSGLINNGSALSWSHTCGAGANKLLAFVGYGLTTGSDWISPTYNGVAMTRETSSHAGNWSSVECFRLDNPSTGGAFTLSAPQATGGTLQMAGASISFSGANAGACPGVGSANANPSSSPAVTVTGSASGDIAAAAVFTDLGPTNSTTPTFTQFAETEDINADSDWNAQYNLSPGTNQSMSWSFGGSSDNWAAVGLSVRGAAAAATPPFAPNPRIITRERKALGGGLSTMARVTPQPFTPVDNTPQPTGATNVAANVKPRAAIKFDPPSRGPLLAHQGTATGISVTVVSNISGSADMVFGEDSTQLVATGVLTGSAAVAFGTGSATLSALGVIAGSADIVFDSTAGAAATGALAGESDLVFDASGTLDQPSGFLAGSADVIFIATGQLDGQTSLTATAAAVFDGTSSLAGLGVLAGSSAAVFGSSAAVQATGNLVGTASLLFGGSATPDGGTAPAAAADNAILAHKHVLRGKALQGKAMRTS